MGHLGERPLRLRRRVFVELGESDPKQASRKPQHYCAPTSRQTNHSPQFYLSAVFWTSLALQPAASASSACYFCTRCSGADFISPYSVWGGLLLLIEWPRAKRLKGSTTLARWSADRCNGRRAADERRGQHHITWFLKKLGFITRLYLIRGVIYTLLVQQLYQPSALIDTQPGRARVLQPALHAGRRGARPCWVRP